MLQRGARLAALRALSDRNRDGRFNSGGIIDTITVAVCLSATLRHIHLQRCCYNEHTNQDQEREEVRRCAHICSLKQALRSRVLDRQPCVALMRLPAPKRHVIRVLCCGSLHAAQITDNVCRSVSSRATVKRSISHHASCGTVTNVPHCRRVRTSCCLQLFASSRGLFSCYKIVAEQTASSGTGAFATHL